MIHSSSTALLLLSGGQDSATCLAWALERYSHVHTLGFDYGQRHQVELEARQKIRAYYQGHPIWGPRLGDDHKLSLPAFREIGETAMTADLPIECLDNGLPSTFVPGRNIAFLALAGALAVNIGADILVAGMCGTDAAGYPDCRVDTMAAMGETLRLGIDDRLQLKTPLITLTKADIWALAHRLGGDQLVSVIVEESHTCYRGDRSQRYEWGYGCGTCFACIEREKGWTEWQGRP
ncbi:MAG: 7-cyano-7-deazaguanine synthase QueC [Pseudomonadota bacterium]